MRRCNNSTHGEYVPLVYRISVWSGTVLHCPVRYAGVFTGLDPFGQLRVEF
jgi:hypothetical protein